ncbi:hypothetical protein F2Q69_00024212 [Brassica cretica]|uniref:RNase H type-1 domain-containing protein n=1 Tax=Brassica cretica TaxID=69181 RepID=A0A8S9QII9_BRACR|nr:hypothetical protein F2Q69_00024212 [Brassica cretica]
MLMMKNFFIPEEVGNLIPWIVWYLWKFRNGILFESRSKTATEVVVKALEEAEFWLLAQKNDELREKEELEAMTVVRKSWSVPPRGWLKGNIGVDWNRAQVRSGATWVVRDERGKVRLHKRRAFSNIRSLEEAKYQAMLWTLESFHSHHLDRIIIAIDDATLPSIVLRPRAWPSFKCQHAEIMKRMEKISYVALGTSFWLMELFENEEWMSSVVPPRGWLKGNIGVDWNRGQVRSGATWVVRDERGKVRLHRRRAFSNIRSLEGAKYQAMLWALESFHSHHLDRIIIAIDDATLPSIVLRPRAWPNFKCQHAEIMKRMEKIVW